MFVYTPAIGRRYPNSLSGRTPNPINTGNTTAGRPAESVKNAKTEMKTKMVAMRFREDDYATIKKKAEKVNMNFTEFVTAAALGRSITIIDGLPEVLREQKAIGRNLNQLTTLCNMGKILCPDLSEVKKQYAEVLAKLNELMRRCC